MFAKLVTCRKRKWKEEGGGCVCVCVCDCCSIQRCLKQQRRPSRASTDGSLSVTCVAVGASRIVSGNKREQKHCSQTKNGLSVQASQLKLNCESGITLYIKKEKKENNLALSPLVVFFFCFNLWSGLRNQICCRCFIFFSVNVNCLAKKKTDL